MTSPRVSVRRIGPLSILVVLSGWGMAALALAVVSPQIPVHFFADGYMDRSGPRTSLWLLPGLLTFVYVLLTAIQFVPPERLNVPVTVTDANRDRVYALAEGLSRATRLGALVTLLCVEWSIIHAVGNGVVDQQFYLVSLVPMVAVFLWLGSFIVRMRRA